MPLSLAEKAKLQKLYNDLTDRVLSPGDPVYVDEVNARRPDDVDTVEVMATEIKWQEGGGVCLFTGQRGTGKSTELLRLKKLLEDGGAVVFYADLSEYLLLTKEIEITDFLVSIAGALSEKLDARYGRSPGKEGYWERFVRFLQTDVQLNEVKAGYGGVELKAALKADPTFKQHVQQATRGHVARVIGDAHAFMQEAVAFVRKKEGNPSTKVVFLIDSVERIRGVGEEAMKVFESVRNLFFGHGDALCVPLLNLVYTVPPYLSVIAAGAGLLMGGATTHSLVSTHVFLDRSRTPDPRGLQVLRKVVEARFPTWKTIFSEEAMNRLALSSGGDLREFFHLLRLCLPRVVDSSELPLSAEAVVHAENSVRRAMLPIPEENLQWLHRISKNHEACLAKESELPLLAHFLDSRLVLNYRNGSDWYDVHPLLRDVIDRVAPSA
jgi:hypothetical protein